MPLEPIDPARTANAPTAGCRNIDAGIQKRGKHGLAGRDSNLEMGASQRQGVWLGIGIDRQRRRHESLDMDALIRPITGCLLEVVDHAFRTAAAESFVSSCPP